MATSDFKPSTSGQSAPASGFIPALDAINAAELGMHQIEQMRTLFAVIKRLAGDDKGIYGLADNGLYWAESAHNDLDVFREDAEAKSLAG
jgi:hypothetical protein